MDGLVSVFEYKGILRRMVTKIKFKFVSNMLDTVVEMLVSMGDFTPLEKKRWLVVGVPMDKRKLESRGFNQAEELAKRLAYYFGWDYGERVLVKVKKTKDQIGLGEKERWVNVRGAFGVSEKLGNMELGEKDVLLVDDVWTTGATMRECAKVLKRAGVRQVWGLVVAS